MPGTLNKTQWLAAVSTLAPFTSSPEQLDSTTLRDRLVECDAVMRAAPFNVRGDFGEIREDVLQEAARQHASAIEAKGLHWPRPRYAGVRALFDLAVHIRAIDELLRDYDSRNHVVTRKPERWKDTTGTSYVVPTRRPRVLDAQAGEGFRAGYNKRGTIHHRVVPTEVDGLPVKVVISGKLGTSCALRPISGGCAVFPELELDCVQKNERFTVKEIRCGDVAHTIRDQISALADCHLLVWPELTIDDEALKVLSQTLKRRSLTEENGPAFVLAGSWHRLDEAGRMRNRAPLLNGTGRKLEWFSKIARYGDKKLGYEDVTSGEEFIVVVTEDCIATVGICKDFSDLQNNPWAELPVDIVLIASMGEDATMHGHLTRAADLSKGHQRRTLVAQQGLWNYDENPTNYVLRPVKDVPTDVKDTYLAEPHATSEIEK